MRRAIEGDKEVRSVGVREARTQALVLEEARHVVGVLRVARDRITAVQFRIRVGIVCLQAEATPDRLGESKLRAPSLAAAAVGTLIDRERTVEQVRSAGRRAGRIRLSRRLDGKIPGYRHVHNERLDVLVVERQGERRIPVRVPLDRQVFLGRTVGVEIGVASRSCQRAGVERSARHDVGVVRPRHHFCRRKTHHDILPHIVGHVQGGQRIRVVALRGGRNEAAERIIDRAGSAGEDCAVCGLLRANDAQAEVSAPVIALEVAHDKAARGLLLCREALLRIQHASRLFKLSKEHALHGTCVHLPIAGQSARAGDVLEVVPRR